MVWWSKNGGPSSANPESHYNLQSSVCQPVLLSVRNPHLYKCVLHHRIPYFTSLLFLSFAFFSKQSPSSLLGDLLYFVGGNMGSFHTSVNVFVRASKHKTLMVSPVPGLRVPVFPLCQHVLMCVWDPHPVLLCLSPRNSNSSVTCLVFPQVEGITYFYS